MPDGEGPLTIFAARELWTCKRLSTGAMHVLWALDAHAPKKPATFHLGDRQLADEAHVNRGRLPEFCSEIEAAFGRRVFARGAPVKSKCSYWLARNVPVDIWYLIGTSSNRPKHLVPAEYQMDTHLVPAEYQTGTSEVPASFLSGGELSARAPARTREGPPRTPLPEDGSPHPASAGSPPCPGGGDTPDPDPEMLIPPPAAPEPPVTGGPPDPGQALRAASGGRTGPGRAPATVGDALSGFAARALEHMTPDQRAAFAARLQKASGAS